MILGHPKSSSFVRNLANVSTAGRSGYGGERSYNAAGTGNAAYLTGM